MAKFFNGRGLNKRLIIGGVLLLAVAGVAALELTDTTHLFHEEKRAVTASGNSFNTKGQPKQNKSEQTTDNDGGSSASATASAGSQKSPGSSAGLITPFGNFVSNHRPNLGGSPAPNIMSSVCNTTPSANCKITFSRSGAVKALPSQTVGANGSTYWNWKLQDIGLTAGTWKIQAVAELNGQTKTATDALDLEVSQ